MTRLVRPVPRICFWLLLGVLPGNSADAGNQLSPFALFPPYSKNDEEMMRMLDGSEDKIDLALANYLIVADLPEFKNLSREQYYERLDVAFARVKSVLTRFEQSEKSPEIQDRTEPIFRFGSAMIALGIDYKEEFQTETITPEMMEKLYSEPDNVFLAGLLRSSRGSCVSMPMLYLIIGQRLGLPLHMVTIGRHCFVRWQEKDWWYNIETTITKQVAITDSNDNYYDIEALTPETIKGTNALRNLTKREVVGLMYHARCGYWTAKGSSFNRQAYVDLTRAKALAPDDDGIIKNKAAFDRHLEKTGAAAQMEEEINETIRRRKTSWQRSTVPMPSVPMPSPFGRR